MASIETIAETLRELAASTAKPKDLMHAVREKHPSASEKEVVRAAIYALIDSHGADPEHMKDLHAFALNERASEEGEAPKAAKLRKKKHGKEEHAGRAAPRAFCSASGRSISPEAVCANDIIAKHLGTTPASSARRAPWARLSPAGARPIRLMPTSR